MSSQAGQLIIAIHILPNICRSKSNQTKKFGQLIEYNMINIFLLKSYAKYGGETSPRPFYIKSKLSISLDEKSEILQNLLLLFVQAEVYQNIFKLRCCLLAFTSYRN